MRLFALVLLPALAGLAAYLSRRRTFRTAALLGTAGLHTAVVALLWQGPPLVAPGGWLRVDALGLMALTVVSLLFLAVAVYAVGFLQVDRPRGGRVFVSCLLGFLAAATLVTLSHHLALLWIGMEATTLALAPLVFHRHDRRSLEAVWKYLVLSSVGIGLALFGTFFLAAAQVRGRPLILEDLVQHAATLEPGLLRGAFIFLLVGYGTKMGLAPLHAWKPDTYGEAPSLVAGLMAGALTSCAFLGLARAVEVMAAAGQVGFMRPPLLGLGIVSLVVSAAFVIGQTDLKRLLAYSSIEHMGILALALGIGGAGSWGAGLHLINNGLTKGLLFLVVGNVVLCYGTSEAAAIRGALRRAPWSGALLLAGLFAVTGSPPFGLFVSEFTILGAAVRQGLTGVAILMVGLLAIIFIGMAAMILEVVYGTPAEEGEPARETAWLLAGPIALGALVLMLGIYLPGPLRTLLGEAARALGGTAP
ncbi:MAG TPA: proton-conducting transporter membrane subunit [Gemmatimonadales bacterium]|jgi:hydrogenase-4 component F|nr:proton-conducting transporter membrane subunit [Gemmatimonadales bacterium]